MTKPQLMTSASIALMLTSGLGSSLAAQTPRPIPTSAPAPVPQLRALPPETRKAARLEGELVKVDAASRLLTIKTRAGTEHVRYTDDTRVIGAQTRLADLSPLDRPRLTVKFAGTSAARVAAEVTVAKNQ